jgi:hypothetical protein
LPTLRPNQVGGGEPVARSAMSASRRLKFTIILTMQSSILISGLVHADGAGIADERHQRIGGGEAHGALRAHVLAGELARAPPLTPLSMRAASATTFSPAAVAA